MALLTAEGRADLTAIRLDSACLGEALGAERSGFNVYEDTPGFSNRDDICTGMCFVAKLFYEKVDFLPSTEPGRDIEVSLFSVDPHVRGAENLRALCSSSPEMGERVRKMMFVGHLRNASFDSYRARVRGKLNLLNDGETVNEIAERAGKGQPSVVFYVDPALPKHGHTVLAYKVLNFSNGRVVYVYDPEFRYRKVSKGRRATVILYDARAGQLRLTPGDYRDIFTCDSWRIVCAE